MNHYYGDILALTTQPPLWFDERAVPRYCLFSPNETANIYARACCLLLIECQNCETEFKVALSEDTLSLATFHVTKHGYATTMVERAVRGDLYYGDPPNINCCGAGPTMGSVSKEVLEFWERDNFEWRRRHDLEKTITD